MIDGDALNTALESIHKVLKPHEFNAGEIWQVFSSPLRVHASGGTYMILNVDKPEHSIFVEAVLNLLNLSDGRQHKMSYRPKDSLYYKRLDNA
jgi:hypothetical protein